MKDLHVTEGLHTALSVYLLLNGRNLKVPNLPSILLFCHFFLKGDKHYLNSDRIVKGLDELKNWKLLDGSI